MSYSSDGAKFTISASGNNPTIQSDFYFLFGTVSVLMTAAPGTGIVSSIVFESDCLDEIDWEWIGGNNQQCQTNYFGKGYTGTYDREQWVSAPAPQDQVNNYTVNWQEDKTEWYVNSVLMRTLTYAGASNGAYYPQTPMRVKIGTWAGGDTTLNSEGTVEWAGGATDYSQGPFTATLQSVQITNANPASSYTYGDHSGDYSSIKITAPSAKFRRQLSQPF